jgi:hypothetical protein
MKHTCVIDFIFFLKAKSLCLIIIFLKEKKKKTTTTSGDVHRLSS